jgi:hypothetical protein
LLVDGGLSGTYDAICRRAERAASRGGRCELELLVVTHVDADHIEAIVKLLANLPSYLHIHHVWFNGWRHLPAPISGRHRLGPPHGEMLSASIVDAKIPWNRAFNGGPVAVPPARHAPILLPGGLKVTVLSPTLDGLAALRPVWRQTCREAHILPGSVASGLRALRRHPRLRPRRLGAALNVAALARAPVEADKTVAKPMAAASRCSSSIGGSDACWPAMRTRRRSQRPCGR